MLDKFLNPTPTFYKWDRFWVGFLPALLLPLISFLLFYVITYANAKYNQQIIFEFGTFLRTMKGATVFLRTATLCCIPNGAIFFFLIQRNYNNASRAVVITTMLYVIAIVVNDVLLSI
ncbi:MAG: hypothetical protein JWO06_3331 [Bacteroidota bacterium]|nr:hypothetical protein [Bacteroidota bacterium]